MARPDRVLRQLIHERFVVSLLDGSTFVGLLADQDERVLVLVDATQLGANGDQMRVDGSLFVERSRIAYMQRPPTT